MNIEDLYQRYSMTETHPEQVAAVREQAPAEQEQWRHRHAEAHGMTPRPHLVAENHVLGGASTGSL